MPVPPFASTLDHAARVRLLDERHPRGVAGGVETDAPRDALTALGCDLQQGHLHGRAMPLADALARVEARCHAARPDMPEYTR